MLIIKTLSLINYGIQIEAVNNSDWLKNSVDVLFLGSVRWIVRDGVYQLLQGNNFFYQSPNTMASFEHIGTPFVKITFFLIVATLTYLILPVLG